MYGAVSHLLTLEVYNRVQINEYAAVITYPYFFVYCVNNLAGPIPAPHTTRFVVRSDELLYSRYGRSTIGVERPILVPSNVILGT